MKKITMNYEFYEHSSYGKEKVLVLLHGWSLSLKTFNNVIIHLKKHFSILTIDLIGFGKSQDPPIPFTLDLYRDQVKLLIEELEIKSIILLGHSFGGRIALNYALAYPKEIDKLILVDSAGIKHFKFKTMFSIIKYKILKILNKIFRFKKFKKYLEKCGSRDYRNLTPVMKKTMTNIMKPNFKKKIKDISNETLILWGYYDCTTPYKDAFIFHNNIDKSQFVTFNRSGHFPYIDEEVKFCDVIIKYIYGEAND